jgi:hypothetical protein
VDGGGRQLMVRVDPQSTAHRRGRAAVATGDLSARVGALGRAATKRGWSRTSTR